MKPTEPRPERQRAASGRRIVATTLTLLLGASAAPFALRVDVAQADTTTLAAVSASGDRALDIDFQNAPAAGHTLIQDYTEDGTGFTADPTWQSSTANGGNCNGTIVRADAPVNSTWTTGMDISARYAWPGCARYVAGQTSDTSSQYGLMRLARGLGQLAQDLGDVGANPATNGVIAAYTDNGIQAAGIMAQTTSRKTLPANRYYAYSIDVGTVNQINCPQIRFEWQGQQDATTNTWVTATPVNVCSATPPFNLTKRTYAVDGRTIYTARLQSANGVKVAPGNENMLFRVNNLTATSAGNDGGFDNLRFIDATPTVTKAFASTDNTVGDTVNLTITVHNSAEEASKTDFGLTDDLADGLQVVGTPTTTCGNGTVTVTNGNLITLAGGDLAGDQASCVITVAVKSSTAGTYSNGPSQMTGTFVDLPTQDVRATWALASDQPEATTTPLNTAVTLDPFANFVPVAGDTTPSRPNTSTFLFSNGQTSMTTTEGQWTYSAATGLVTFTPAPNYTGTTPAMPYTYSDTNGNPVASTATVSVGGGVSDLSGSGDQGSPVAVPLTGNLGVNGSTLVFTTAGQPAGSTVSADGKTLTVPNEGTWTIAADGTITFTPDAGYQGSPTPVAYTGTDGTGAQVPSATVTVTYPDVEPLTPTGTPGEPLTVSPVGTNIVASTVTFPAAGQPAGASVSADGKTLTVPNEGVWTVAADGTMTFTPDAGFLAAPSAVLYTAADSTGNLAQPAPITVTYPDVVDLTGAGDQGATITVTPQGTAIDPTTTVFPTTGQPAGATVSSDGKTLTVPGEGVYTIAADGAITFTPDPALVGDPTPVTYTAADADGNVADPAQITLTYPDVSDVSKSGVPGQPVSVAPAGDQLDLSTVLFPAAGQPANATISADGKTATVAGEGTWTIDPTTGVMTFAPAAGFTTSPTPLLYTASNTQGSVAEPATVTVLYPSATPVSGSGDQGTPVVLTPTFDPTSDPTTVKLTGGPEGSTLSADGKTLTVPNEGTWTVNPDGSITFTPVDGFQGDPTPVKYTVADKDGNESLPVDVMVSYPDVTDVSVLAPLGSPATLDTALTPDMDPASVVYPTEGQPAGSTVSADGKTLTVPGEGVWTVNPEGDLVFTPEATFTGNPTPVQWTASDAAGNVAEPATATALYPVLVDPAVGSGDQGTPVTVTPTFSDNLDPATVQLTTTGAPEGSTLSPDGKTLTVPNEGTWTVNPDGSITFTPEPGFQGDPTPATFTVRDDAGNTSNPATATVTYPDVDDTSAFAPLGSPALLDTALTPDMDPTSVVFTLDGQPPFATVSNDGKTLTVAGQGVWTATAMGDLVFTPDAGFTGTPAPVQWTASDALGNVAEPATATALYPVLVDPAVASGDQGTPVTVTPTFSDNLDPSTVQLTTTGAPEGSTLSADGKTLTVPNEGMWTVNPDGSLTFTPEPGFQGDPTPVQFTVRDDAGNTSNLATATVTYPDVSDTSALAPLGSPALLDTALTADMDPATVVYTVDGQPAGSTVSADGKTLTVPGEGVWTVTPEGDLVFTPEATFSGNPTPVQWTASDAAGNVAEPATATALYPVLVDPAVGSGDQGTPVTVTPTFSDNLDPATVQLTEGPAGSTLSPDGKTLTVPNEGTWTVNPDGSLTFTPEPGFQGDPTPVQFTVRDDAGNTSNLATGTVTYPDVSDTSALAPLGSPALLDTALTADMDPASVVILTTNLPDGTTVTDGGKTVTVPGEGVWTVAPEGDLVFTPEATFTGNPTPVQWTASDAAGNIAEPATATALYPVLVDPAVGSGDQGTPVTVTPTFSDNLDPATVQLTTTGAPEGSTLSPDGKTLTVPNEGTWTVNPDGSLTFTPEPGFQGDPTPVTFTVRDDAGNTSNSATATVTYPDVSDTSAFAPLGSPALLDTALTPDMDPASVVYPTDGQPAGSTVSADGKTLTVPGEGVWTVTPEGDLVFTPEATFTGNPTPVQWTASDAAGNIAEPATATALYPVLVDPAVGSGDQGTPVTVTPTFSDNLDPSTVELTTTGAPEGSTLSPDGKTLTVPNEGTWTVNPDGSMTFTPEPGFQGDPTPVQFTVRDDAGNTSNPATATVTYPDVSDTSAFAPLGSPATLDTALTPDMDPATVVYTVDGQPAGSTVSADGKTLTVPGEGVWTVNPEGDLVFTPEATFTGNPTPVQWTASDLDGNVAEPATATALYPVLVDPAVGSGDQGTPVTVTPTFSDNLDPATVQLTEGPAGSTLSPDGKTLTVPNEGTWTVNPDGSITFTPEPGFQGDPTPVTFTVRDDAGNTSNPATATVTYPDVSDTSANAPLGSPALLDTALTPDMDPASVVILTTNLPDGTTVTDGGKTVTVPGEGVWTVTPEGDLVFTPEEGFTSSPTPVQWTASDLDGNVAEPATATAIYPGALSPATGSGDQGTPVTVTPTFGDNLDRSTVTLTEGPAGSTLSPDGKTLTVPNEGTWTVNPDGSITFTPEPGFQGDPTPVKFTALDNAGNPTTPATATVTYPDVQDTSVNAPLGEPATLDTALTPDMDPASVVYPAEGQPAGATLSADGKTLTVPNQGVWTVTAEGDLVFTPDAGFTSDPTPVRWTASNAQGNVAEPATATALYPGALTPATGSGDQGTPVTVTPGFAGNLDRSTVQLTTTGTPEGSTLSPDGKTLTVPNEGTWTVNPDGSLTFTPEPGFQGNPTPVTFTALDNAGNSSNPATATVTYPDVQDAQGRGVPGTPTTLDTALTPDMDPASVVYPTAGQPAGATLSDDGKTLTVPGEGVWTVTAEGNLVFTPDASFTGNPSQVRFEASDTAGNVAEPATATVVYPGQVSSASGSGDQGAPVTVTPVLSDNVDPATVELTTTGAPEGSTLSPDGKTLTVPNEGTWTVNPDGSITFTPKPGFQGSPTPVTFTAVDATGEPAGPATATVTYPDVEDAAVDSAPGATVVVTPTGTNIDPATIEFPAAGQPSGAVVSEGGKVLTVPGEGVWTVLPDGSIQFVPEAGLKTSPTPIVFTARDSQGHVAEPGTITVTYPTPIDTSTPTPPYTGTPEPTLTVPPTTAPTPPAPTPTVSVAPTPVVTQPEEPQVWIDRLARTGANVEGMLGAAGGMIAAAVGLLAFSRRRRNK